MTEGLTSPCGVCGFDATEWTAQDLQRTLAHDDDLIAGWSAGAPASLRPAIVRVEVPIGDDHDEPAQRVHELWHRLVAIADLRRASGDVVATQHGVLTQISRSRGGVPKLAVESADIDPRGIVGDVQKTRVHHGRPWQALCLWSADVIDTLIAEGHPIGPGSAGENLTISGIDWASLRAGTVVDIGAVRCQLSAPATPCSKNKRWFRDGEIDRMDHDLHPGSSRWYASVLVPGSITTGDTVTVEPPFA